MESFGFGPSLRVAPTNFSITAGRAKVMAETETQGRATTTASWQMAHFVLNFISV